MYYVIRSRNEVLCAEACNLTAERSEYTDKLMFWKQNKQNLIFLKELFVNQSFQYVRFRNEFVKIWVRNFKSFT
jgi:hypothetical protein